LYQPGVKLKTDNVRRIMRNNLRRPGVTIPLHTPESNPDLFRAWEAAKNIINTSYLTPKSLREIEIDILLIANIYYEYSLQGITNNQMTEIISDLRSAWTHFDYERGRIGARIRSSTLRKLQDIKNLP
jgi:hypothetical protein